MADHFGPMKNRSVYVYTSRRRPQSEKLKLGGQRMTAPPIGQTDGLGFIGTRKLFISW